MAKLADICLERYSTACSLSEEQRARTWPLELHGAWLTFWGVQALSKGQVTWMRQLAGGESRHLAAQDSGGGPGPSVFPGHSVACK